MRFSSYIEISDFENNKITIKINKPNENMQSDAACFEAVALLLKAENQSCNIGLDFDFDSNDSIPSKNKHYMRFLYRLNRFYNAFDWVSVSQTGLREIRRFNEFIYDQKLYINTPGQNATYNPGKGLEHCIENQFANVKQNYLYKLVKENTGIDMKCVYNQLPNGLFYNQVSDATRIFPTGYFDLWGTSENNEIFLFELKEPGNTKMGIISELFFYATYLNDFYFNSNFNDRDSEFRGFSEIVKLDHPKIKACFLTDGIHKEINAYKNEILSMLNAVDPNIEFYFIEYDKDELDEHTHS